MVTDRELLERAAKAAGFVVRGLARDFVSYLPDDAPHLVIANEQGGDSVWNPLADDGDALRLAVVVKRFPKLLVDGSGVINGYAKQRRSFVPIIEQFSEDPAAATRRAIVRAAAAIGEGM